MMGERGSHSRDPERRTAELRAVRGLVDLFFKGTSSKYKIKLDRKLPVVISRSGSKFDRDQLLNESREYSGLLDTGMMANGHRYEKHRRTSNPRR